MSTALNNLYSESTQSFEFTWGGLFELALDAPVAPVGYYEADA